MSIKDYGRQVVNSAKQEIKNEIKKKVMPIILKYVVPALFAIVAVMSIFFGFMTGEMAEAASATPEMAPATGTAWEQFIRYLHIAEGGGTITKNGHGVDCYTVQPDGGGGSAVGYGVDIATHGATLRALGYSTSIGSLIPVTDVDAIEKKEREERYEQVLNLATTNGINLTQYQLFALTSRTYNYGFAGGTGQATSYFKYPSTMTFVEAYKAYYTSVDNDAYYGDYTKTDFSNSLFTQYMTWLDYADSGTHPAGWETRRKSEWCLFQTGYYGWGLKNGGAYPVGFDEYWQETTVFSGDLYNADGTVNEPKVQELEYNLESTHNIKASGAGFGTWYQIPEGDTDNATRRAVTGEFHGYKEVVDGKPKGANGLSTYQCTWWANGRASEYLKTNGTKYKQYPKNTKAPYGANGDGGEMFAINKLNGWFNYGTEPKPNSLLSTTSSSGYGHVLYIEAVDSINRVYYASEAGSGYKWGGIQKYDFGHHNCDGVNYGFIYLAEPK